MGRQQQSVIGPLLVGAALVFATWTMTRAHYLRQPDDETRYFTQDALSELRPIAEKYGPGRFSRNVEEWAIRDFFHDRRDGVFLDVGANHYRNENNTYFLESQLGWSGIAIDALDEFAADYAAHRPRTRFVAAFVSDVPDRSVQFFVPDENKLVASLDKDFTVREGAPGKPRTVPTTPLDVLLEHAGVQAIDFMSMDIELAEPLALKGFNIDRYAPALVCIEAHIEVRQQILDYFAAHRYVVVGKYLRADAKNLYFQRFVS
jgi:FkbM family methyltransferase